jgi:hypothetical protein
VSTGWGLGCFGAGPPGTGKTFVAKAILKLLLSASTRPAGPIVVVTLKKCVPGVWLGRLGEVASEIFQRGSLFCCATSVLGDVLLCLQTVRCTYSHALDQLLLGLMENGAVTMAEIARLGSRSQESQLDSVRVTQGVVVEGPNWSQSLQVPIACADLPWGFACLRSPSARSWQRPQRQCCLEKPPSSCMPSRTRPGRWVRIGSCFTH